jgi:hypothetical protein
VASDNLSVAQTSAAVSLFQKAHGRMTTIQRIDEQVGALQEQRRKLQDELRAVQALINEEFERVMSGAPSESPNRMLAHMAEPQGDADGHDSERDSEMTEAVA